MDALESIIRKVILVNFGISINIFKLDFILEVYMGTSDFIVSQKKHVDIEIASIQTNRL